METSESRTYQPYQPTRWESRIDQAFGLVSPKKALSRMVDRERMNWFRYLAAQPTSARQNSSPTTAGEWLRIQREKMQVMWNAIDMVDNSGLCSGILIKFPTYVCGTLGWQARTGDKNVNRQYQQYIKEKTCKPGNIDITRRFTLRQMCMLDVKCIALKGDVGTNIVREDDEIYLQGIESNRIGDPYKYVTSQTYVRGLVLDADTGRIESVRVFYQDKRSGFYRFDDEYEMRDERGLPKFLFFTNPIPISFDDYRGVSLFKHAIDNATYIDRMRQYELQALMWAAAQSGVFHTKSGALPDSLPFDNRRIQDKSGNFIDTYEVRPNTVTALADGEDVTMFQHDRPSPNVIGMYENTVRDIAIGAGFTYGFAYDMTGITGPAVRNCSAQDARTIGTWQSMITEQKLDPTVMLLLGEAIAKKELPYHPNWLQWAWFFPAKPTIDVGRESDANIAEIGAGVNTGANVVAEAGLGDVEEVITQRSHEAETMIEAAQEVADRLKLDWQEVYIRMFPPKTSGGAHTAAVKSAENAAGVVSKNGKNGQGATDDPEDLSGDEEMSSRNGHRDGPYIIQKFFTGRQEFDADSGRTQDRDDHGRFTDEGKSGDNGGGGGTAVATKPKSIATDTKPEMSALDKKLIDYKPGERPLSDPTKTTPITDILPNSRHVAYTKMPFFRALSAIHGVIDPEKVDPKQYKLMRDEIMNQQPVEDVPFDKLVVTQPGVNNDKISEMAKFPIGVGTRGTPLTPNHVVRYKGENYLLNGHHRSVSEFHKGAKTFKANVLKLNDDEIKTYEASAKAKSEFDSMVNGFAAAHGAEAVTTPLNSNGTPTSPGTLKSLKRSRAKVEGDYGGDWSQLKDVVRGRIMTDSWGKVQEIGADIEKKLGIKPKITLDPDSGYRDYKFRPMVEGRMTELAIAEKHIVAMTNETHAPYEKIQFITRNAIQGKRALTPEEQAQVTDFNNHIKSIFGQGIAHAASAASLIDKHT